MAGKVSLPSLHGNEREADGVGGRHLGTRVGHVALRERERGKARQCTHSEGNMQSAVTVDRKMAQFNALCCDCVHRSYI